MKIQHASITKSETKKLNKRAILRMLQMLLYTDSLVLSSLVYN